MALNSGLDTWISVRHVGYFHWLVDDKDDFHFLGMKFAKKSILGPKWELTPNVGMKSAFSPLLKN